MAFLSDLILIPSTAIDAARVPVVDVDGPSLDIERLESVLRSAPRLEAKNLDPTHVEALVAVVGGKRTRLYELRADDALSLWPVPDPAVEAIAKLDHVGEKRIGDDWARRAKAPGLAMLLPKVVRFVQKKQAGDCLVLEITV
jgi:hypothetical protein